MKVSLKNVRLSFPALFEPKEFEPGDGKPRYDATFLIEPGSDNDKKIQAAIEQVGREKMEKKWDAWRKGNEGNANKWAYLDGDTKEYDGYAGMLYLSCHRKASDGKPLIIDQAKNELKPDSGKPYAGCYVNASVDIYAQTGQNPGLRASFSGVQFAKDGDAFSGGAPASKDEFDEVTDGADADDFS